MARHKSLIREQRVTLSSGSKYMANADRVFENVKESDSLEMRKLGFVVIEDKVSDPVEPVVEEKVEEEKVEEKPKKKAKKKSIFKKSEE